ncbi:Palmitoyltransferase zdhhc17 [Agyrium rufum]|nr:Palmitoyltransferase zdhhc17 [Agyrium rufum]
MSDESTLVEDLQREQRESSPPTLNNKASRSSDDSAHRKKDGMELSNIPASETKLPLHEDVMQLARLGEIAPIEKLFAEGKYTATYKDEEGITPLHWAAINNHYALCQFLISAGADVNALGGEAVATPTMWAVQRCNYYAVHLLLQSGADPLLTDAQGYNILHLATFDGNVFLILLLLHQNIPIDAPDPQGHTCLMWAAYKGYPAVVDLLLRWGASVNATDEKGFTALHWAIVKGSQLCMLRLVEYGSDRFAVTSDNKTPAVIAEEMKSASAWQRVLSESGYDEAGNTLVPPFPFGPTWKLPATLNRAFFCFPFAVVFVEIWIASHMAIYFSIPMMALVAYLLQFGMQKILVWGPSDMKHLYKTPYLAGIFASTLFWVGALWLFRILPNTLTSSPIMNFVFGTSFSACGYFYTMCMIEDPGYIPKTGSRSQQKAVIDELISLWKFEEQNFCVQCMIRTPLRNLEVLPPPASSTCNILAEGICNIILRDNYAVVLAIWAALQLTWVTMLFFVQGVQIAMGRTTYESMHGRIDHASPLTQMTIAGATAGATSVSGAQIGQAGGHGHGRGHGHPEGWFAQWKKLLGLDTFVATAQSGLDGGRSKKKQNPFSRGIVTNCRDFWFDPAPYFGRREVGTGMLDGEVVNYTRMYESPHRIKRRANAEGGGVDESVGAGEEVV